MHAKLAFTVMLCLRTKPCCVWVQINVLWVQIQVLSALEFMLCFNSSSSCVWGQSDVFVLMKCMLYLSWNSCCEYNCVLYYSANICDSTPCKNGGTCSISGRSYTCSCRDGFSGNQCQGTFNTYFILCVDCKFKPNLTDRG